jgi:uracil phosphoribosyltransferase
MNSSLKVLDNPVISNWLFNLRNKDSNNVVFRQAVDLLSQAVLLESALNFGSKKVFYETPVGQADGRVLDQRFVIVSILRAGIGMVDPILKWLPDAQVYHLGATRNHDTLLPEFYYDKLPKSLSNFRCLVVDPMLATGGSALESIRRLRKHGAAKIDFLGLIGSRPGVHNLHSEFPDVSITLAALDDKLNEKGYINPGLGDAGDRFFNT